MNLLYEGEVSQLTLGGHKGPETLLVGPELADLQDSLGSSHAGVGPLQVIIQARSSIFEFYIKFRLKKFRNMSSTMPYLVKLTLR